jgi:hypothetical protein
VHEDAYPSQTHDMIVRSNDDRPVEVYLCPDDTLAAESSMCSQYCANSKLLSYLDVISQQMCDVDENRQHHVDTVSLLDTPIKLINDKVCIRV